MLRLGVAKSGSTLARFAGAGDLTLSTTIGGDCERWTVLVLMAGVGEETR